MSRARAPRAALPAMPGRDHASVPARSSRRTSAADGRRREDQEDPASRRRLREVEVLEAHLVEEEGRRVGAGAGTAPGHHEDDVEQLDRVQQPESDGEQDHGHELGQRDVAERLPAVHAVDQRRLIRLGRERRQPGEQDDEHERRPLPHVGENERHEVPRERAEPVDGHGMAEELAEQVVHRPKRALQQQRPELADDHGADEQGDDQHRGHEAPPGERSSKEQREAEAERELDSHVQDREHDRREQRRACDRDRRRPG